MEIKEGYIDFLNYKTYYRITNPKGKKTPFLMLHGGPGSTHNSFELFDNLAIQDDRPIIMYDQIGCGLSSIPNGHTELWNKEFWVSELENVREKLGLKKIHLMGQSWGGMLAIIYLCDTNPKGVLSVTLSSTLSSASLWERETHRLIRLMDEKKQAIIYDAEIKNDFSSKKAKEAMEEYYHRYIFGPWHEGKDPECLTRLKPDSSECYKVAWGDSEFLPTGTLKDYEYTDKLKNITCPVLLCSGANDESTPYQNKMMYDHITTKKRWHLYQNSRHMSYYEEHALYIKNLSDFLNENE
jgi:proline iminopeptidase